MKILRGALLSIVCALPVSLISQVYQPVPDTNAYWKEVYAFFLPGNPVTTIQDEFVNGDTMIGSYRYTKVYANGITRTNTSTTPFVNRYLGAVRDDSSTQRVYFVQVLDTAVQLLYDFNLTVGQLTPQSTVYNAQFTITSIDSVYYLNAWHQQFHTSVNGPAGELAFIEGMGSTYGLTVCYCSTLQMMYCFYQDDRPCYPDTSYGCATEVSVPEHESDYELIAYPNPAALTLTIQMEGTETGTISVFNQQGALISEETIQLQAQVELDVSDYAKGIYLLVFTSANGIRLSRKFIVE